MQSSSLVASLLSLTVMTHFCVEPQCFWLASGYRKDRRSGEKQTKKYPQKFSLFSCFHGGYAIGFALRMKFFSSVEICSLYGHFVVGGGGRRGGVGGGHHHGEKVEEGMVRSVRFFWSRDRRRCNKILKRGLRGSHHGHYDALFDSSLNALFICIMIGVSPLFTVAYFGEFLINPCQ